MDGTPRNPNKPRLSRRLLSHFTLTLSVLLALSFITLGIIGPTTEEVQADTIPWDDVAVIGANAAVGAAAGFAVGDGLGAVIGAAGFAVIGAIAVLMAHDRADSALSAAAKASYASALKNITVDYFGLASAQVDNLNTLWNTSQFYLIRKAEWAAQQLYDYQIAHGLSTVYDPYYVLANSEVANATISYTWAMGEQMAAILNAHTDLAATFVGTYEGMSWGFTSSVSSSGNAPATSTLSSKSARTSEFMSMASTEYGTKYATVAANSTIYLINTGASTRTNTIKIAARNGTEAVSQTVTLAPAEFKTFNLESLGFSSGDYTFSRYNSVLENDDLRWFGQFSAPIAGAGTIYPAMISFYKDGENAIPDVMIVDAGEAGGVRYMRPLSSGALTWGLGTGTPYIWFSTGSTYSASPYKIDLNPCFDKLAVMLSRTSTLQTTANTFAQSYYNYLVANGPDAPRIMPDILFPDPTQLEGMSWQQIYAMLLAYLTQMDPWFEENSVMGQDDVNISAESLDLLCRGAIYNASGGLVYNDTTVWTPYISLDDMTLTAGQNNTMTQPGFIIVWGNAADLHNFTQPTTCVYLPITAGWNLSIEEMTLKGVQVTETTLTVTNIEWVIYGPGGNITPPQITTLTDLDWIISHWYYIAIIGGVICLLGAIATRNTAILVTGLVLMAAGAAGWYLAGDTSLLDWLSMEPPNLRAWLQNLR